MSNTEGSGPAKRKADDDITNPNRLKQPKKSATTTQIPHHNCLMGRFCNHKLHPFPEHQRPGKKNFVPQRDPNYTVREVYPTVIITGSSQLEDSEIQAPKDKARRASDPVVMKRSKFPGLGFGRPLLPLDESSTAPQKTSTPPPQTTPPRQTTLPTGSTQKGKGKGKDKGLTMVNVVRTTSASQQEMTGDEDEPAVSLASIKYDQKSDYPAGISKNYTGKRKLKSDSFPERNVSLMKARLGISKMVWKRSRGSKKSWVHIDELASANVALSKELLRALGKHDCSNKLANRKG